MIYANLLYFLVAILLFSAAPLSENTTFPASMDLLSIFLVLWIFWYFNKYHFTAVRERFDGEDININQAKKHFSIRLNIHIIFAIFLFAVEIFFFDLKTFLVRNPVIGSSDTIINVLGLIIFMFHLSIIWYWAFRAMGDVLDIGKSANDYIIANAKFNLVIVLPWLILILFLELFSFIDTPWMNFFLNSGLFVILFLFVIAIFAPLLIVFLWDCKPIAESDLKSAIISLGKSRGVKFRGIMSWGAMNQSLITAGVVGLIARLRFLLITPRLMKMLNEEETLAVASHEIGHVKKKHMLYYLLFFVCFIILSFAAYNGLITFLGSTEFGLGMIVTEKGIDTDVINYWLVFAMIVLFIVYFRFVFGYFMRNFERQADTYCFDTGIGPDPMIASFMKLGAAVGEDSKKSNWHHYNIAQRIDFLRKCVADPGKIKQHNKKVKRSLVIFFAAFIIFGIVIAPLTQGPLWPDEKSYYNSWLKAFEKKAESYPNSPELQTILGMLYYELEKWEAAKKAYEKSLSIHYNQPEVLNNLAWLLLKCPQEDLLDNKLALKFSQDAIRLRQAYYIYDTLAESLLANKMYEEAVEAAKRALDLTIENRKYYKDQLKKMEKLYRESKAIRI